jgi:hypothetical protein
MFYFLEPPNPGRKKEVCLIMVAKEKRGKATLEKHGFMSLPTDDQLNV